MKEQITIAMTKDDFIYMVKSIIKDSLKDIYQDHRMRIQKESENFKFMPLNDIVDKGLLTAPTIYKYAKEGRYKIYKFGNRTFVDREEFENSFKAVNL